MFFFFGHILFDFQPKRAQEAPFPDAFLQHHLLTNSIQYSMGQITLQLGFRLRPRGFAARPFRVLLISNEK